MKLFLIVIAVVISTSLLCQSEDTKEQDEDRSGITIGILQGGGSLIGADVEVLITDRFGVQLGGGFLGYGGGLNYHFKPRLKSSFISLQYWNQGIGENFAQNVIGVNYVHRSEGWLTFQIGLGVPLSKGPALDDDFNQPPVMLMYSAGFFATFERGN